MTKKTKKPGKRSAEIIDMASKKALLDLGRAGVDLKKWAMERGVPADKAEVVADVAADCWLVMVDKISDAKTDSWTEEQLIELLKEAFEISLQTYAEIKSIIDDVKIVGTVNSRRIAIKALAKRHDMTEAEMETFIEKTGGLKDPEP